MRFLINAQLPPAFCERLRGHGCEAAHVSSLGMASASDAAIWTLAKTESWVVVTKDEDFALRKSLDPDGPPILWLRWPNTRRAELIARFEAALPAALAALDHSSLVEIR